MEMEFSGNFFIFYQSFDELWLDERLTWIEDSLCSSAFTSSSGCFELMTALGSQLSCFKQCFSMEAWAGSVALLVSEAAPFISILGGKGPTWAICNQFHCHWSRLHWEKMHWESLPGSCFPLLLFGKELSLDQLWFKRENQRIQVLGKISRLFSHWEQLPDPGSALT